MLTLKIVKFSTILRHLLLLSFQQNTTWFFCYSIENFKSSAQFLAHFLFSIAEKKPSGTVIILKLPTSCKDKHLINFFSFILGDFLNSPRLFPNVKFLPVPEVMLSIYLIRMGRNFQDGRSNSWKWNLDIYGFY